MGCENKDRCQIPMYQLRFKDNSQTIFPVTENLCTLGSAAENTLVLNTSTVDAVHARLIQHEGRLFLQDNKSRIGSFVNGSKIKYKELKHGDVVTIGNVHFDIVQVDDNNLAATKIPTAAQRSATHTTANWRLVSDSSWLSGKMFDILDNGTTIGRGKDCTIVIPGSHLSRNHATIRRSGDQLILQDMNSANGCFVNEIRVNGEQVIKAGDRLRFDVYSFRVHGPAIAGNGDSSGNNTENNRRNDAPTAPLPRKILNLDTTLQNIEALKSQGYQQKEWITKPTSHGNRYHEVPVHKNGLGLMFWVSAILGLGVLGVLGYIVFKL
jgi:pSer/pThr/pTyr-binding forkhead associated (FHA) protein